MKVIKNGLKTLYYKWKAEGKKAQENKRLKKERSSNMPPQYKYRKAGIITFWSLFGFMLLMSLLLLLSLFGGGEKGNKQKVEPEPQNPSTMQPAVEFSKAFVQEYYTFDSKEDATERAERLDSFLVKQMNDGVGIDFDSNKNLKYKVESVDLKKIEEAGKNKGYITLKANIKQTEYVTEKKEVKKGKKTVEEEIEKPIEKEMSKYITVPVIYEAGTYAVYEYPKFTKVNEKKKVDYRSKNNNYSLNQQYDSDVKTFLETYFEVYASQTKDKIEYMHDGNIDMNTLNGDFKFVDIEDTKVYQNKKKSDQFLAVTDVRFEDDLGTRFTTKYHIILTRNDDGKFLVKNLGEK